MKMYDLSTKSELGKTSNIKNEIYFSSIIYKNDIVLKITTSTRSSPR
jgi:hypothetical protein